MRVAIVENTQITHHGQVGVALHEVGALYSEWEKRTGARGWDVEYKKGLASLEDDEYEEIIKNPRLLRIKNDPLYRLSLKNWFGKDSAPRKEALLKL